MIHPMVFHWNGEAMIPHNAKRADREFVVGQNYPLIQHEDRTSATHNHEFGWLKDAWLNLPESLSDLYPTSEHLRKRALIDAGYYNEEIIDAGSNAAALRVASAFRKREEFSLVIVRGAFVIIRTAKSQSRRSMDKKEFQASKTAIMEIIEGMTGAKASEHQANAEQAA